MTKILFEQRPGQHAEKRASVPLMHAVDMPVTKSADQQSYETVSDRALSFTNLWKVLRWTCTSIACCTIDAPITSSADCIGQSHETVSDIHSVNIMA